MDPSLAMNWALVPITNTRAFSARLATPVGAYEVVLKGKIGPSGFEWGPITAFCNANKQCAGIVFTGERDPVAYGFEPSGTIGPIDTLMSMHLVAMDARFGRGSYIAKCIAACSNLRYLHLDGLIGTDEEQLEVARVVLDLQDLCSIAIPDLRITRALLDVIILAFRNPNLRSLALGVHTRRGLTSALPCVEFAESLMLVLPVSRLDTLSLFQFPVHHTGRLLAALPPTMKVLALSGVGLNDNDLALIVRESRILTLVRLDLSKNSITDTRPLSAILIVPGIKLRHIDLRENPLAENSKTDMYEAGCGQLVIDFSP